MIILKVAFIIDICSYELGRVAKRKYYWSILNAWKMKTLMIEDLRSLRDCVALKLPRVYGFEILCP